MGATGSKVNFRKAVIDLTSRTSKLDDETFWEQFWSPANVETAADVFAMIPAADIRSLRENSPNNLATLCYKTVERIVASRDSPKTMQAKRLINCVRLLTRLLPYMFEDRDWRGYFWTALPGQEGGQETIPLASALLGALSDLLFCPGFTVTASMNSTPGQQFDLSTLDSCEYIWENGVGFAGKPMHNAEHDTNRMEILKLLLTCFSEVIYAPITDTERMRWLHHFTSAENRHVLPLFTSLLNVVCAYDPVGYGLPYNYLLFADSREPLVQTALQTLIVCLDLEAQPAVSGGDENGYADNFFINYLSRIHREEDFDFMLKGITRLLSNPLQSTYLPNSAKKVTFYQELLVLLWKCCEHNQVFHKLITTGNQRLQSLFDCLLTIIVNVSPYLKSLTMVSANKLMHLVEAFSTPWFLFSSPSNHHLVFFLLEVFNNIIQYQFDGNSNLIYTIIRKRQVFYQLANLNADSASIAKSLTNRKGGAVRAEPVGGSDLPSPSSPRASPSPGLLIGEKTDPTDPVPVSGGTPGVLNPTLAATPQVSSMVRSGTTSPTPEGGDAWEPTPDWVESWKIKLPLQTVMRLLQVLVPQVEKICIDKGLTDESEILKFLQHGTLVGLLPVPHPILIRKYQANAGTNHWFRTYMWGVIYLRNTDPPIWYDTDVKLFEIQRV